MQHTYRTDSHASRPTGRPYRSHSLSDYSQKDFERFRRSASSPSPVDPANPASPEHFVKSCLSSAEEAVSTAEYRSRNVYGGHTKRQKTAHRQHDVNEVNYVQRAFTPAVSECRKPPCSASGDESSSSTPSGGSRRESTASFVSTATADSTATGGMGGDSEREDDMIGGANRSGNFVGRKRRFPMFGATPPPLVSNTPEYPSLTPSPVVPHMVH